MGGKYLITGELTRIVNKFTQLNTTTFIGTQRNID
jgi:hypothetical protein